MTLLLLWIHEIRVLYRSSLGVQVTITIMKNLAAHALTGCDTVSSFSGKVKILFWKGWHHSMEPWTIALGETGDVATIVQTCLSFVSLLYNYENETDLSLMRADIFRNKLKGNRHLARKLLSMPTILPSFEAHCLRAHFQVSLWKAAGQSTYPAIDPLQYGWEISGTTLLPKKCPEDQQPTPKLSKMHLGTN